MTSISKKEIDYVADLARIKLTEKEKENYAEEISAILSFIDKLKNADTSSSEVLYQTTGLTGGTRKDDSGNGTDQSKINSIIDQAPEKEGNFFKVKAILEKK